MSTLEKAIEIAAKAHAGQIDKGGAPYILHPLRVMMALKTTDEKIVGVLHDVPEDTDIGFVELAQEGFSEDILTALRSVTKLENESRIEAAHRAAKNRIGRKVKLADNQDNSDITRIPHPTEQDSARLIEYAKVREILLAFKVPDSELAEAFVEEYCKLNSSFLNDLSDYVRGIISLGATYLEIQESIKHNILLIEYRDVRRRLPHAETLEAASNGLDLIHLSRGMEVLLKNGMRQDVAYSTLRSAHANGYYVFAYARCIAIGCTEVEIQEIQDIQKAKLDLQFYASLRKYFQMPHEAILATVRSGTGIREQLMSKCDLLD